jgi:hypothetical protein
MKPPNSHGRFGREMEIKIYRVIQEESAIRLEMMVRVILSKKVHKNMGPIFERLPRYGKKKLRTILRERTVIM